jgi:hypothetical protein
MTSPESPTKQGLPQPEHEELVALLNGLADGALSGFTCLPVLGLRRAPGPRPAAAVRADEGRRRLVAADASCCDGPDDGRCGGGCDPCRLDADRKPGRLESTGGGR